MDSYNKYMWRVYIEHFLTNLTNMYLTWIDRHDMWTNVWCCIESIKTEHSCEIEWKPQFIICFLFPRGNGYRGDCCVGLSNRWKPDQRRWLSWSVAEENWHSMCFARIGRTAIDPSSSTRLHDSSDSDQVSPLRTYEAVPVKIPSTSLRDHRLDGSRTSSPGLIYGLAIAHWDRYYIRVGDSTVIWWHGTDFRLRTSLNFSPVSITGLIN